MEPMLAQSGPGVASQVLNLVFSVVCFAIPLYIIFAIFKHMKSSRANQARILEKLDEIAKAQQGK